MSSNSSSSDHKHPMPPRVVIVKSNSTALNYDGISFGSNKDDDQLKDIGVVLLRNNTHIRFNFTGTGVAVTAMNHSFPPIPDQYLPRWSCTINDTLSLTPTSHSSHHQNNETSEIPSDNYARVCDSNQLPPGLHTLVVNVDIPSLPAYFHSIRYIPIQDAMVNDAILRIDAGDRTAISYNSTCWDYHKDGPLQANCSGSAININFHGESIKWFGSNKLPSKLSVTVDGKDHPLKHHDFANSGSSFTVDNLHLGDHNLTILNPPEHLTLDHLFVTVGNPTFVQLADNSPTNSPTPSSTPSNLPPSASGNVSPISPAIVIGSAIGGIVGFILCCLIVYLVIRCIRGRRRRNNWKDSALPPAILNPASRVSSRSSFSREVVTGDLEYNPEAQKKLENASMTSITSPPAALIVHVDGGWRFPFRASEVPPRYAQV